VKEVFSKIPIENRQIRQIIANVGEVEEQKTSRKVHWPQILDSCEII